MSIKNYDRLGRVREIDSQGNAVLHNGEQVRHVFLTGNVNAGDSIYWCKRGNFTNINMIAVAPCPQCRTDLIVGDESMVCPGCSATYPHPPTEHGSDPEAQPLLEEREEESKSRILRFAEELLG